MPQPVREDHPAIAFDRVAKAYGGHVAIDGVSLGVAHGQFVALVGGSGAGKTTLLKTVNALIAPDSGVVRVEGRPTAEVDPPELRRGIGYVFQEIGLFPHLTVARNIAITPRLLGWSEADIAARVSELLDLVALPRDFARRKPSALSGGQRQRVGVARALAARPKIMLMDEPFGALDPVTRAQLGEDYRALHDALGLTTMMVTHDVMEAALLADRIVVMKAGRVIADGSPRELMAGHHDPDVAELMQTPRRQAERIEALLHG